MSRRLHVLCVWSGVAVAVWLLPASIHIVDWAAGGPTRVALLAPLRQLLAAVGATSVCALAFAILDVRLGDKSPVFAAVSPLAQMWLWAIPYLPWIPDRAPALLVLAGPLRWSVLALALIGSATALWTPRSGLTLTWLPGRGTIFVLSLAAYLGFGLWSAKAVGPGADEPHYLVITQSLLRDHDLAIENNHARGDYREYFGGDLRPDFLRRGLNEVIYSIHAPGLPALLVPAYAVGGYIGAVTMLCLFGALAALAIFDLASLLTGTRVAWITWLAVCLTVPFVPHSWLIFPEMPATLLMAWGALWLYAPFPPRERTWLWRGAALAVLPWLHTKFVILLAAMLAALCLRLWGRWRAAAWLVVPSVVSLVLWIGSFSALYGSFDPEIPYGDFPKLYVLVANIPRGVLGLLFDQKFGLLMYAPVYAIAIAGCWMMLRRTDLRLFGIALLSTGVLFVAASTRMYMWWGGSSAPARFLVPILPLVAPMIAVAFRELRSTTARMVATLLLVSSLAIAVAGVVAPRRFMLFSAPHGLSNLAVAAQGPSPLADLLPTFTEGGVREPLTLLAPWASAAVLATVALVLVSRLPGTGAAFATTATGLTAFLITGSVLAGSPASLQQRTSEALRGRLDLMRAYEGPDVRAFDYSQRRTIHEADLFAMTAIHVSRASGETTASGASFAGPFDLPAGRFRARVQMDSSASEAHANDVSVLLGNRITIARGPASRGSQPIAFDLPVDATVWLAASDPARAASVHEVDIVAESIVPRHSRPHVDAHAIEPIEGRPGALLVYANGETYPEGGVYWTQDTRAGEVYVAPAGASTLALTLHVGPVEGTVRVVVDGHDRSVTMSRDQTQRIEIPLTPADRLVPVLVQAPGSFRPSDQEPGSTDRRWLGCQVRIELR